MYQDRGMMKWQGFFLSEHTEDIGRAAYEAKKEKKPQLDEYQIEEFETLIANSMDSDYFLRMRLWKDGFIRERVVKVNFIDHITKNLIALDKENQSHIISFNSIIDVQLI